MGDRIKIDRSEIFGPITVTRAMDYGVRGEVTCKVCGRTVPRASRTQKDTCGRAECKSRWAKMRGGR